MMKVALSVAIASLAFAVTPAVSLAAAEDESGYDVKRIIYKYFGSGWLGRKMVCIASRESGLNPWASNWRDTNGGSHGLFQINGANAPGGWATRSWIQRMYDPWINVATAYSLYRRNGLSPWAATAGGC
jgi:hypothetical protein